jgi:hypothetical protein
VPRLRIKDVPLMETDVAVLPVVMVMVSKSPANVPLMVVGMFGVIAAAKEEFPITIRLPALTVVKLVIVSPIVIVPFSTPGLRKKNSVPPV